MGADLEHLWPPFRENVRALLVDPEAKALGMWVVSGFRSDELQASLFADAVRRYGSPAAARKWVAPPGTSHHGPRAGNDGHPPGPYGLAVDLGVAGVLAVDGKWPKAIKAKVVALTRRFEMFSPMAWEDWHHEPTAEMFARAHPHPLHPPQEDLEPMAPIVDPKTPADPEGRLPNWEVDEAGNIENWNGARQLRSLSAFDPRFAGADHPRIVGAELAEGGDGIILFADDGFQLPDGRWVRSTYKITVGM